MRTFRTVTVGALVAAGVLVAGAGAASAAHTPKTPVSTVTSIAPDHGSTGGGTIVKIKGKNLVTASAVYFGSAAATSMSIDGHAVLATSPAQSAGPVNVTVTTSDGTTAVTSADQFTYELDTPTVSSVSPKSGTANGGAKVTIGGSNLSGATAVDFGSTPATITGNTANAVTVLSPAGSVGTVPITVTTGSGTSPSDPVAQYTYKLTPPKVTSVSLDSGPVGQTVTIKGSGFAKATAVDFGGVSAQFTIVSGKDISAVVPAGTGTVEVTVTDANGTSAIDPPATEFTYTQPSDS